MERKSHGNGPGPSRSKPSTRKMNIWQQVDRIGEMNAPDVHHVNQQHELDIEGVTVYDQQALEQGMINQMDAAFNERKKVLEVKRANREIKLVQADIREVKFSIAQAERTLGIVTSQAHDKETKKRLDSIKCQKSNKEKQLKTLQAKLKRLQKTAGLISEDETESSTQDQEIEKATSSAVSWTLTGQNDEERDRLIKLGYMTPFGSVAEVSQKIEEKPPKKKFFLDEGFNNFLSAQIKPKKKSDKDKMPKKRVKTNTELNKNFKIPKKGKGTGLKSWLEDESTDIVDEAAGNEGTLSPKNGSEAVELESTSKASPEGSDEDYIPDQDETSRIEQEEEINERMMERDIDHERKPIKQPKYDPDTGLPIYEYEDEFEKKSSKLKLKKGYTRIKDDGKIENYKNRMEIYRRKIAEEKSLGIEIPEDKDLGNGFKVPGRIWSKLYKYQKTGVRWMFELHSQKVGGILGDEMGLGKTVQIISFLAGLQLSGLRSRSVPGHAYEGLGPVLIVTPTTVMHQWVREFQTWWPPARVAILHDSGTFDSSRAQLIDNISQTKGILITSFERARINIEMLLEYGWHYVILDEGHKIRNPEAAVTTALKLFRTPHRLILSGSPVQNNLRELWSLFDFIFPGKLGTLPVFMEQFSIPITQGGYSNATEIQVHTAYKCACKLRDTISPYLLRRMKRDVQVAIDLPSKNEQVLFCRLSEHQIEVYKKYLDSDAVHSILTREMKVFAGLIQLRKICNHPDLYTGGPKIMVGEATPNPEDERSFGFYKRSGKMLVIASLLKIWKKQGHKVLLFTQSKAMLDVLEIFVSSKGYRYFTMHGGTPVSSRQPLVSRFNKDPSLFVFLLTTRVGGLGVNLTGANRVVIFDPDWNPSTDAQAQERAWRIGQKRDVTIYRLLTSGTIEEKIYHRQIFKQFLSNRILKDPLQRRFFKSNDLHELFLLKDYGDEEKSDKKKDGETANCKTETAAIFAGTGSEVLPKKKKMLQKQENNQLMIMVNSKTKYAITSGKSKPESKLADQTKLDKEPKQDMISILPQKPAITSDYSNAKSTNFGIYSEETGKITTLPLEEDIKTDDLKDAMKDGEISENRNGKTTPSFKESLMKAKLKFEEKKRAEELDIMTKENKKSRKNKRKRKKAEVDGEIVNNVTAVEQFKSNNDSAEVIEEKSKKATDDYVLRRLFKRAGVHSALQHNTIMDSAHPDFALIEVEAERVAKESVRNLRLSRRQYQFPTGRQSPNTTKLRFGKKPSSTTKRKMEKDDSSVVKLEKEKNKIFKASHIKPESKDDKSDSESESGSSKSNSPAPLSASQLLLSMRRRNHDEIHKQEAFDTAQQNEENEMFGFTISQTSGGLDGCTQNPTEHDEILDDLRNVIAFQCEVDGQARTSEIMSYFGDRVDPEHAAVFKSILKELCTSEDSRDTNEKIWTLKPEFR
uniref:DNA excision repair protein ERCC-6-like isoform X3 n=1 Tax=Styela clava TaxID=7725 RepID=UPI00193AC901|nr:DNA excision repair protein ERCC-6-like isoform X3 [Styela clava]